MQHSLQSGRAVLYLLSYLFCFREPSITDVVITALLFNFFFVREQKNINAIFWVSEYRTIFSTCLKVEKYHHTKSVCWFYQLPADQFVYVCVFRATGGSYETHRVLRNRTSGRRCRKFRVGRSYCWYSFFMTLAIVLSCMLEVPS